MSRGTPYSEGVFLLPTVISKQPLKMKVILNKKRLSTRWYGRRRCNNNSNNDNDDIIILRGNNNHNNISIRFFLSWSSSCLLVVKKWSWLITLLVYCLAVYYIRAVADIQYGSLISLSQFMHSIYHHLNLQCMPYLSNTRKLNFKSG